MLIFTALFTFTLKECLEFLRIASIKNMYLDYCKLCGIYKTYLHINHKPIILIVSKLVIDLYNTLRLAVLDYENFTRYWYRFLLDTLPKMEKINNINNKLKSASCGFSLNLNVCICLLIGKKVIIHLMTNWNTNYLFWSWVVRQENI